MVEDNYAYRDGMIWLGRSASENQVPVGYRDDRHVCLVSGSRGGKGTTSIVNNLVVWPGSICVVDPKGENATITAARRGRGSANCQGMGQAVRVLDPFKAAQVDDSLRGRFNPLDALDPQNEETIDEAGRIADAIVVIHEESNDPFWDESARAMVKGLILHVLTAPEYEGRRNLLTLRKLIMRGDWESVEALREAGEKDIPPAHGLLWQGLANNPAFDGLVAGIGDSFTNMLLNSPKQFESVLQVANRNTEFIDSPGMQRCLEGSDFQLAELKTRPEGLSVYLCLPQRYMSTHYRWLRMMIALTVTEMEKVRGVPATRHPVLLVLDEFAGLKRMEVIERAVAQIAGYGVKMFFVLQSLEQLKGTYKDNWETFLANSGLKVFFNLEDNFSREYVSKLIGETEVIREVRSESDSVSESESLSRSTTRTTSESRTTSTSSGTSESEGTNSSVSSGKSWGINDSESKSWANSWGTSWKPTAFWGRELSGGSDGRTVTESKSRGKSKGWTKGRSDGVSRGTSRSKTDGTSVTQGTSLSETEGTTLGTSQSRTAGTSETIQKRALVTPDEIGQLFARVDDRGRAAYPGMSLVVISGARPVALRRVNYYEDYQFIGLFDPHPDYPFTPWRDLCVEGRYLGISLAQYGLRLGGWSIEQGQLAAGGDAAAPIASITTGIPAAWVRVPRLGLITMVQGGGDGEMPQGPLFSLRHYEDGAALIDPFAEIRAFCAASLRPKEIAAPRKHSARVAVFASLAAIVILAIAVALIKHHGGSGSTNPVNPPAADVQREPAVPVPDNPAVNDQPQPVSSVPDNPSGTLKLAYTLTHKKAQIGTVGFSPDSRLVAYNDDDAINLWDVASGAEPRTIAGHGFISQFTFSPDRRLLASVGGETIHIFDVATGAELRTFEGSTLYLKSVAFSPDGRLLASGGADHMIRLWDAAAGTELRTLAGHKDSVSSTAFSPDGRMLASAGLDHMIKLWDVPTGTELRELTGHKAGINVVAFSPDGRMLASGDLAHTIKLWDVATGAELRTLVQNSGSVRSAAFSPDGRVLASGSQNHLLTLWDVATGAELKTYAGDDPVVSVAFSPDGRLLASLDQETFKLWYVTGAK
jgi:type IV secretory pathway TraG/TraD family ATPase VirD4